MKQVIHIGIDAGTTTGVAAWDSAGKTFNEITSMQIHRAMDLVLRYHRTGELACVRVEDARQVRFGTDKNKAQGAGSIKRDASIWEDFLKDYKIPFKMVRPQKPLTKWDAERFKRQTGYEGKTNSHSRDAALIVYNI